MDGSYLRGIYLRLAGVVTLVVMIALGANAFFSQRTFEQALAPQLAAKVASVGASLRALVLRAVDSGVPFNELYGVTERFGEIRDEAPEVTYFALTDTQGAVRHSKGAAPAGSDHHFRSRDILQLLQANASTSTFKRLDSMYIVSMPIVHDQGPLGVLHLGLDVGIFDALVREMLLDVLVVLVVSLFFTLELMHFIAGAKLEASLRDLSAAFQRGAEGNFTTRPRSRSHQAFASLLTQLDSHLTRVNRAFVKLAREVQANRHAPAHERLPGLARAQAQLQDLARHCRFGLDKSPAHDPETEMVKVRAPLFLFILAEELTRSFLPGYVVELGNPVSWISTEIVVGLPIALFMLIVALAQPFLGVYTERVGHRKAMLIGAGVAATGLAATALAWSVVDLLLWRSLCAVGYAMVFVAAQSYVLEHATRETRARSFALFVGAIMAATVCGPSIGGILADNVGMRPTFAVAAVLALASLGVIHFLPSGAAGASNGRPPARLPTMAEMGSLLRNPRFMVVTALAAIPAKVLLTGVCFYLVPLYIVELGSNQAMAGRILMAYAVVMVVLGPVTAGWARDAARMQWLVGGGLVVSGLGGLALLVGGGVGWVLLGVLLVGLGQSMSISAQSALLAEHCAREIRQLGEGVVYGVYRLLERLGNAAGPMLAAALAMSFSFRLGFVAIGALVCASGVLFLAASWWLLKQRAAQEADDPLTSQPQDPDRTSPRPVPAARRPVFPGGIPGAARPGVPVAGPSLPGLALDEMPARTVTRMRSAPATQPPPAGAVSATADGTRASGFTPSSAFAPSTAFSASRPMPLSASPGPRSAGVAAQAGPSAHAPTGRTLMGSRP